MTEEQMELELALIENEQKAIKKASGAKHYEDPDYEEEERKEEEIDSILSYEYDDPWDTPRESAPKTRAVEDWEDIETDDLDSDDWDE